MYNWDSFIVSSYTDDLTSTPKRVNLHITNTVSRIRSPLTRFKLVDNRFQGDHIILTADEISAIESNWYAFIAIWSSVSIIDIDVSSNLRSWDDNFAVYHSINLGEKEMNIQNANFHTSGTVFKSETTLSLHVKNVFIDIETIVGGIVLVTSCDINWDVMTGEVVIDNVRLDGNWDALFLFGGIYLTGP